MSKKPLLTIGLAVFDDYAGAWPTIQSLHLHHPQAMANAEIVVVDNHPDSADGKLTADFCTKSPKCRYVPMPTPVGTSAPRQRVFEEARGDIVLCVDSHILIPNGGLDALLKYFVEHPQSRDLIQGPMLFDQLHHTSHMRDVWRGEMWGIWATAWRCRCGGDFLFDVAEAEDGGCSYWEVRTQQPVTACPRCHLACPKTAYPGHEGQLTKYGHRPAAANLDAPFAIPAMGLGLFGCRREAWLGFNAKFRGFGGEEYYIHTKYKQAGQQTICLPRLAWAHRFGRPRGVTYPLNLWNKVRNYVIGHTELGLPLDRVYEHFVAPGIMDASGWMQLTVDPANPPEWPAGAAPQVVGEEVMPKPHGKCGQCGKNLTNGHHHNQSSAPAVVTDATLDSWFHVLKSTQHDFSGHEDVLKQWGNCDYLTELGGRRGSSTVCLLAGRPRNYRLIDPNGGAELAALQKMASATQFSHDAQRSEQAEPHPTDVLVIDTNHHQTQLLLELRRYGPHVRQSIVIHDTVLHAVKGEGEQPGLMFAIRQWLEENPQWFVASHDPKRYGLTVLARDPLPRPVERIHLWRPNGGPGTELELILASLGITPGPTCDCKAKAAKMDTWGIEGCRANRDTIINWMREGQGRWKWTDKLAAAARAVATGLAFKFNPLDPFPGIVDEAISRAEEKEKQRA